MFSPIHLFDKNFEEIFLVKSIDQPGTESTKKNPF
jgi:hypothetical protein